METVSLFFFFYRIWFKKTNLWFTSELKVLLKHFFMRCLSSSLNVWIPRSQAAVSGDDWVSKLPSCSHSAGEFFHKERGPHGLRSRQDSMYTFSSVCYLHYILNITETLSAWFSSVFFLSLPVQVTRRPNLKELSQEHVRCQRWLNKKRIKAFYTHVFADNLRHGAQFLMQVMKPGSKCYSLVKQVSQSLLKRS